ncbi:hypothetical protein [Serinicoccus marinus]|uniref:hypothetical protein n=1 Tax=Serinicoccus marinus TaxID=247333 RepID=UPI001EE8565B|nr:hypothetical protein [Serinicoccus marinus]
MGSRQQDGRRGTDLDGGRPPGVGENEPVEIAILLVLLAVVVIAGEALSERLGAPAAAADRRRDRAVLRAGGAGDPPRA